MTQLRLPYVEKIWRIEDSLEVPEALAAEEAFARLDPLFQTDGTRYAIEGDTLAYVKTNPRAQDPLATFTSGTLRVERGTGGTTRLNYQAASTALLLCFLAPLFFLSITQVMEALNHYEATKAQAEAKTEKKKDEAKDKPVPKLHPIDVMLGAPAPKDPKAEAAKDAGKTKEPKPKFKTTQAYVLSGLFFVIFLVGRVLEPWLLKRTFRRALTTAPGAAASGTGTGDDPDPALAAPA